MTEAAAPKKKHGLREVFAALGQPRVAAMLALGFASGLPFLLTGATFGFWLADAGTTATAIGFLSWVGLAYSFKYLWSPLVDRLPAPFFGGLGRRRGWAVFVQLVIGAALVLMAIIGPHGPGGLTTIGLLALVVAFASATQDIALDAWRIESASDPDELGLFSSAFQLGYRVALLVSDALILIFAQHLGWPMSYVIMALLMGVGLFAAFRTPEPERADAAIQEQIKAEAAETAAHKPPPAWRIYVAGACFAIAAAWLYWTTHTAGEGVDLTRSAPFGTLFSLAFIVAGVCAVVPAIRSFAWYLGAASVALIVVAAFYSAMTGVDYLGGAGIFWPVVTCGIASALVAPPSVYSAIIGPFVAFVRAHGRIAILMLAMISVYRLPEFLIGPVAGPFYHDLGLSKDVIGGVRGSIGLIASFVGIAAGGLCTLRLGYMPTLILGAILQGFGVAMYALVAHTGPDLHVFALAMASDNFCYAFAGVALVTYMSSLTSLGYTATQYALMSSAYAILGKFLKGFSGAVVDNLTLTHARMDAYAIFYIGAGAVALPALIFCLMLASRRIVGKTATPA
jgi:MFS family permease